MTSRSNLRRFCGHRGRGGHTELAKKACPRLAQWRDHATYDKRFWPALYMDIMRMGGPTSQIATSKYFFQAKTYAIDFTL